MAEEKQTFDLAELDAQTTAGTFAVADIREDLTKCTAAYCSMVAADNRAKTALYNATSSPRKIKEIINKQIRLTHIYADVITVKGEDGLPVLAPRVVLIDDKAQGYQSVSIGMYESVRRIFQIFGTPDTWSKPLLVEIIPVDLKNGGTTYNLKVIFE